MLHTKDWSSNFHFLVPESFHRIFISVYLKVFIQKLVQIGTIVSV